MPNSPKTVSVLLFPEFSNLCLANAVEPLRAANRLAGQDLYAWRYIGLGAGAIAASSGLPVHLRGALATDPGGDRLLIMPSYGFERLATPMTLRTLRAARGRFAQLIGLDTGSWLMAAAGLFDGREATIHWDLLARFAETFPEVDVTPARYVASADLASCGGGATALELMLHLIAQDHGTPLSLEVAALFMHGERAPAHDLGLNLPNARVVQAAAAIMRRHIESPLPIGAIAARLGLSQRMLEARCREAAAPTPRQIYRAIRLSEVRRLTDQTTLPIAEIAARCGYADATAMTRAFHAQYGAAPNVWRRRATAG